MRLSAKLNQSLQPLFVRYVLRAYRRKIKRVEVKHPELFKPVAPELVKLHRELWGSLGLPCSDRWLRFFVNLTGNQDHRYCPEDIFFARLERILNPMDMAGHGIEDKNCLDAYLGHGHFPTTILRYMRGNFFDNEYRWLDERKAVKLLQENHGDLIVKPCLESSGGRGVALASFREGVYRIGNELLNIEYIKRHGGTSYGVQQKIESDAFVSQFNPTSANTCRIMILRRPWDGKIVVAKSMMRFGVDNNVVDNMMKGGLCVTMNERGEFDRYGYDYVGGCHEEHPTSKLRFEGVKTPGIALWRKQQLLWQRKFPTTIY